MHKRLFNGVFSVEAVAQYIPDLYCFCIFIDFTAAMIAAEMKARELQLWKEVDGIFSCDPVSPDIMPRQREETNFYLAHL